MQRVGTELGGNEVWINEVLGHHGMKLEHFAEAFHAEGAHQPHSSWKSCWGLNFESSTWLRASG